MYVVLRTAHSNHPWRHTPMGTRGIARMSRLKSEPEVFRNTCDSRSRSRWVPGRFPDFANKVLIIYDGEFNYTCRVSPSFDHNNQRNLRAEINRCIVDRWFPSFGEYPGYLSVYEHGEHIYKAIFVLRRRQTSRFPRNDIQFKVDSRDWSRLCLTSPSFVSIPAHHIWLQA